MDWVMDTLPGLIQKVDDIKTDVDDANTGSIKVLYNNNIK